VAALRLDSAEVESQEMAGIRGMLCPEADVPLEKPRAIGEERLSTPKRPPMDGSFPDAQQAPIFY